MPEWDAEIAVAPDLARRLIAEQFPALAALPPRLIGSGWDNTVYAAGEHWGLPLSAPRGRASRACAREIDVRAAARTAPAGPGPRAGAQRSRSAPVAVLGMRPDPGISRDQLALQLGRALRALHSHEVFDELGSRLGENWTHRADMQRRVPILREKAAQLDGVWRPPGALDRLLDEALELPPPAPCAVCHGDLHFRHVLVDGDRVTGLIDWIDLCRGDPALDLQLVWSMLPPPMRETFFVEYGDVDGGTMLRARVTAIFLGCALLDYGVQERVPAIEAEARVALDRAFAD